MNQTLKSTTTPESFVLRRRIGSTTYKVGIHFNRDAEETLEDKIRRLLKNDLQSASGDGKMDLLQADRLSERGSL